MEVMEAVKEAGRKYGYDQLKKEQGSILVKFLTGHDVFVDLISAR